MPRLVLRSYWPLLLAALQAGAVAYALRALSRYVGLNVLLPGWMGEAIHQTVLLCAFLAALLYEQPHPSRRNALLATLAPAALVLYDVYMAYLHGWPWLLSAATAAGFGYTLYILLDEEAALHSSSRAARWHRLIGRRRRV